MMETTYFDGDVVVTHNPDWSGTAHIEYCNNGEISDEMKMPGSLAQSVFDYDPDDHLLEMLGEISQALHGFTPEEDWCRTAKRIHQAVSTGEFPNPQEALADGLE